MEQNKKSKPLPLKDLWTFTTYFTEGFPFSIFRSVSAIFFRDMKVPLESIGLTSLYGLPWIIKLLWGPWIDEYSTKRRWLLSTQAVLLAVFILTCLVAPMPFNVRAIAVLFFLASFVAATHDIAIDGYYMEALDKEGQARYVGVRIMAYRVALICGTSGVVTVAALVNWTVGFAVATFIFCIFFLYHLFFLAEVQQSEKRIKRLVKEILSFKKILIIGVIFSLLIMAYRFFQSPQFKGWSQKFSWMKNLNFAHFIALLLLIGLSIVGIMAKKIKLFLLKNRENKYTEAFLTFVDRDKIGIILFFIIFLRAGEWTLTNMVPPLMVDLGIKLHYGWISGFVSIPSAIIGAMLGGWLISRYGLKKMIWPFVITQNITNLIYMLMAIHLKYFIFINTGSRHPMTIGAGNIFLVALVHGFDQFASGLGNAVLMTYVMRICLQRFKAAHYAIGSGLWNISGLLAGILSGFVASWLGYSGLFAFSFIISVPAMLAIPFLPHLDK